MMMETQLSLFNCKIIRVKNNKIERIGKVFPH